MCGILLRCVTAPHRKRFTTVGSIHYRVWYSFPFRSINCSIALNFYSLLLIFTMILSVVSQVVLRNVYCRYILSMYAPDILHIHACVFSLCTLKYTGLLELGSCKLMLLWHTLLPPQCFLSRSRIPLYWSVYESGEIVIRHSVKYCCKAGNLVTCSRRSSCCIFFCRLNYSVWFWSFPLCALDLNVIWVTRVKKYCTTTVFVSARFCLPVDCIMYY